MYEFRVTKYDPALRRADGTYSVDTWTSEADIGGAFQGRTFTVDEYLGVESRYVQAVEKAIVSLELQAVGICSIEGPCEQPGGPLPAVDLSFLGRAETLSGRVVQASVEEASRFACAALREVVWGRLVGRDRFYVHFGTDLYMYVGGESEALCGFRAEGLFVEPFRSPYH